ncbi:hypothetical protein CDL15_Pgr010501 [Punica granatum]|uniref:Uncharacterized protein n=1 Tax=Punica granatum TaxID=22663 RepID=A0A218XW71_PUNGR|nr:hypothetical protein CDL15_Pgr010501 [Punica granatum]
MEGEIAKLLVQMSAADGPHGESMLQSRLTRKRGKRTARETTRSKRQKPTAQNPPTKTSEHVSPRVTTVERSPPMGTPAPSASNLKPSTSLLSESLTFWENNAFCKQQDDKETVNGVMLDKLFAEGAQYQLQALRFSHIQQVLVKRLVSELEGARSELSQFRAQQDNLATAQKQLEERLAGSLSQLESARSELCQLHAQQDNLTTAQKQLEEQLAEVERRLKEEEEARHNEKDQFQKEKEELLNALEEERDHTQEAVAEAKAKAVAEYKASETFQPDLRARKRAGIDYAFNVMTKKAMEMFPNIKPKLEATMKMRQAPCWLQPPASSS